MAKSSVAAAAEAGTTQASPMMFADLLTSQLEGVEGTEVVVSITTVPPHTTLPKHWHPGEEFAYVLEGSLMLWQEGKPDEIYKKGEGFPVRKRQTYPPTPFP